MEDRYRVIFFQISLLLSSALPMCRVFCTVHTDSIVASEINLVRLVSSIDQFLLTAGHACLEGLDSDNRLAKISICFQKSIQYVHNVNVNVFGFIVKPRLGGKRALWLRCLHNTTQRILKSTLISSYSEHGRKYIFDDFDEQYYYVPLLTTSDKYHE